MKTQIYKKRSIILQQMKTQRNSFKKLRRLLKAKKVILYGWPTIKIKYFKGLKKENSLLAWFKI